MAEVGLVRFAQVALDVAEATVPRYRVLYLMRYEDWTFREAEVRLGEHRELRRALGLASVPDYTTLYRFRRLHEADLAHARPEVVYRVPWRRGRRATVAVDATGLAQDTVNTFFVRRMYHHTQPPLPWRHWLKWLAVVDLERQLILAQSARQAPWNDCANLPVLVAQAHAHPPVGSVSWLMPSSIPSVTTPPSASSFMPRASSPPSAAKGEFMASEHQCVPIFQARNTAPFLDRDGLLRGETKTVLSWSRPNHSYSNSTSSAVRPRL